MTLSSQDFRAAIRALGIEGKCVEVHSSFKSFGAQVDGGAQTVIDAFTAEGCTFLVFSYTTDFYGVYPPQDMRPSRNAAGDYTQFEHEIYDASRIYTTASKEIMRGELGLLPYTVVQSPLRKRGYSPLNSFSAIGDCADELVRVQTAIDVFAPLRRLCELDGYVLLMGVNLERATIIHYAEQEAGRAPFVRWANDLQGAPMACHVGSCSNGFGKFDEKLRAIEKTVTVGQSLWRCFPAREMVDICACAIRETPEITRCGNPSCERCADAIAGGPVW